jgi:CubicO group peptidase (beta-lactamase class C family)
MYRVSFFIAALLTLFTRLPAYAVDSTAVQFTQLLLQYDEAAEKSLDADAAPGAAIAIVRDGRVVYIKSIRFFGLPPYLKGLRLF